MINIQNATGKKITPTDAQLETWLNALFKELNLEDKSLTLRIINSEEMKALHNEYSGTNRPTNVLAFPFEGPEDLEPGYLGDITLCDGVIESEAVDYEIPPLEHWAHITLHGTLHLLGYTHKGDEDAEKMENLETKLMEQLGYSDPY